jgi:hypothetical protein
VCDFQKISNKFPLKINKHKQKDNLAKNRKKPKFRDFFFVCVYQPLSTWGVVVGVAKGLCESEGKKKQKRIYKWIII